MKSIFILHEGNEKKTNDNQLLKLLIEHLKLDVDLISFYGMGSKSNFFKIEEYPTVLTEGVKNEQIDKVLFVVDADYDNESDRVHGGFDKTQNELDKIIHFLNFEKVSSTFITCDPETKAGYLESFILSTIPEKQRNCIERFLKCSQFKSKENHKAILNQIYKMAYPNAPYNFKHPHFDSLKSELNNLFKIE